jgi:mannose-6-phosphate isomerase-like protein (cupin superfamily)
MHPAIQRSNDTDEFETAERCSILEVSNDPDDPEVSIARARVAAGITTEWHKLKNTTERYLIISGQGRVEVGALDPADLRAGDVVRIPADTRQRITNTSDVDLIFYAICTPWFKAECYQAL